MDSGESIDRCAQRLKTKKFGVLLRQITERICAKLPSESAPNYRKSTKKHLENGNYGLIEIKLGGEDDIEKGAKGLKELVDKIDTTRMKNPSFMMVLVGLGRYAYRRDDGVYVVPIGCLKP